MFKDKYQIHKNIENVEFHDILKIPIVYISRHFQDIIPFIYIPQLWFYHRNRSSIKYYLVFRINSTRILIGISFQFLEQRFLTLPRSFWEMANHLLAKTLKYPSGPTRLWLSLESRPGKPAVIMSYVWTTQPEKTRWKSTWIS